jgi:hypothetical protein
MWLMGLDGCLDVGANRLLHSSNAPTRNVRFQTPAKSLKLLNRAFSKA